MTSTNGHTSLEMTTYPMNNCDVSDTDENDTESGEDYELEPMLARQIYRKGGSEKHRRKRIANFIEQHGIRDKTRNQDTQNTQSFGDIKFVGFGPNIKKTPYIRVDNDTQPNIIWNLLINQWNMYIPKVLISVTGGTINYHFKSRLKTLFKEGLIKAAVSTGVWIITRGIDAGVSKIVGEAIKEVHQDIVLLGMEPWDNVDNNEALHGNSSEGMWPAKYVASDLSNQMPALDCNHTHFILMDHGREELGYQIDVRDNLEQYIRDGEKGKKTTHIPVVLVVIGGNTETIGKVYKSLVPVSGKQIPAVVIYGSGGAADLIVEALRITHGKPDEQIRDIIKDHLTENIQKIFLKPVTALDVSAVNECIDTLSEIVNSQNRCMITIFDMNSPTSTKDIDKAILCGLLKDKHVSENIGAQLQLAMRLDRCDIAEEQIITCGKRNYWKNLNFEKHMEEALIENKVDFVSMFLEHVIQLNKFLTISRLHALYTKVIKAEAITGRLSTYAVVL